MSYEEIFEKWEEYQRERRKAKQKKIEADSGRYDDRTVYARDLPQILVESRYYCQYCVLDALRPPAHIPLARLYASLVSYIESIMDQYRPIADIMFDDEIEPEYQLLVQKYNLLGDEEEFVDTTTLEDEANGG